jgi:hypothetical protein
MTDKTVTVMPWPQLGEASERARVWHALLLLPTSQVVHRWSTLVKILIDFQYGIKSLAFICGPFNS